MKKPHSCTGSWALLTGNGFTNTWDYRNRLTQTQLSGTTTSYLYDINDERIADGANGATTTYPFSFYNVATSSGGVATITKHIFANGEPVADVQGSTTTAKVYYIHDDALGGANVLSNASGTLTELIEYYPFWRYPFRPALPQRPSANSGASPDMSSIQARGSTIWMRGIRRQRSADFRVKMTYSLVSVATLLEMDGTRAILGRSPQTVPLRRRSMSRS